MSNWYYVVDHRKPVFDLTWARPVKVSSLPLYRSLTTHLKKCYFNSVATGEVFVNM